MSMSGQGVRRLVKPPTRMRPVDAAARTEYGRRYGKTLWKYLIWRMSRCRLLVFPTPCPNQNRFRRAREPCESEDRSHGECFLPLGQLHPEFETALGLREPECSA